MMSNSKSNILVVGIASSAGGLKPLIELIETAICHENMAFILVPHMSREDKSRLPEIMKRITDLKVCVIKQGLNIERCHLYILPPGQYAKVQNNRLILEKRPQKGPNQSANFLFESLSKNYKENAIGVVLSGASVGQDGAKGITDIKNHGGHTYAQSPEEAQFPDMPKAAIETGKVDFVLTAKQIGHDLTLVSWAS